MQIALSDSDEDLASYTADSSNQNGPHLLKSLFFVLLEPFLWI